MTKKTEKLFDELELEIKNYHERFQELITEVPPADKKILLEAIAKIEREHEMAVYYAAKDFVDSFYIYDKADF